MLPASIIVAGVLIAASLFAVVQGSDRTTTSVSISTNTTTLTATTTTTEIQTSTEFNTVTSSIATATSIITSISTLTTVSIYEPFVPPVLEVTLNATTIKSGSAIAATLSLTNVLPYNVTFSPSLTFGSSINGWDARDYLCSGGGEVEYSTFGYAVFGGHEIAGNISSATQLQLAAPIAIGCAAYTNTKTVTFLPNSSEMVGSPTIAGTVFNVTISARVNATTNVCVNSSTSLDCNSDSLFGYWTGSPSPPYRNTNDANTSSPYFSYFTPGDYTLVVEDMWGMTAFSYFQVT